MEATTSASKSSVPNNQSNWIQNVMDSWDAMVAKEASSTRDEPVEILEQCEMVITLQTDGTDMEKATKDLSKSLVSLNPSSILTTTQLPRWNIDHKVVGSRKHSHSDLAPSKPNSKDGKSGGLALFWRMGVDLEVVFPDKIMIVALVYLDPP
nr:hypothetical protein CFP56_48188 [Quercus suber]